MRRRVRRGMIEAKYEKRRRMRRRGGEREMGRDIVHNGREFVYHVSTLRFI